MTRRLLLIGLVAAASGARLDAGQAPVHQLILHETPKPNYGAPASKTVVGRVVLDANADGKADPGEPGVPNAAVSDGYSVVKTDANGAYRLAPAATAVFVYVTRPREHDVVGSWYKPLAAQVDFTLKRADRSEDEYTFIQVTDTHVSTDRRSLVGMSRFVDEVNALDPRPRFVFNSGDLVNLDKQLKASEARGRQYFRLYTGLMNRLRMPYYNVAGDHTDSGYRLDEFPLGDHRAGKAMYWEHLGPNMFSFEYGRVHFVSVDFVYHLGKRPSHKLIPEHVRWLEQDLAARSPGAVCATASEQSLLRSVPDFPALAKRHDLRLQLVGDWHIVAYRAKPVAYRIGGALSGTWWNGPCADLSPQGYMVYQVRGTEMTCFYKGLGRRVEVGAPRFGAGVKGPVVVRASLVQPEPGQTLHYSAAGGPYRPMRETGRPFYRAVFEATWDSTQAPDGEVEVRVKSMPDGEVRRHVLVVNNGAARATFASPATLTFTVGRLIAAGKTPAGKVRVRVNDTPVGVLTPKRRKTYTFDVQASVLRRVNTLRFAFERPDDCVAISHPVLAFGDTRIEDPRAAAIHKVCANHWPKKIVDRAGFYVGGDPDQHSFALRQDTFHFVLPVTSQSP